MRLTKRGKKRLLLLVTAAVLIVGSGVGYWVVRDVMRDRLAVQRRATGLEHFEQGEYQKALGDLSYAVSRNQNDLEALLAFAATRARVIEPNRRHLISAVQLYNRVLALDPKNLDAMAAMVDLRMRLGMRVEAEEAAENLLALDARNVAALEVLIATRRAVGRFADAVGYAERLSRQDPANFGYRAILLRLLREQGVSDPEIVARAAEWIAEHPNPEDGRWHLLHATALIETGRFEEGLNELRAAASLGAKQDVLPAMLQFLDLTNQREAADELLARSTRAFETEAWVHELTIRRHWQALRLEQARAALDFARTSVTERDSSLLRWQAMLAMAENNEAGAREAVETLTSGVAARTAEARDEDRAWAAAVEARLDVTASGWRTALGRYQEAISLAEREPVLHYLAGEAYAMVGEQDLAAASYGRAAELDPMWITAGMSHADTLLRLGRVTEAFEAASALCARTSPTLLMPWLTYLRAWIELERTGQPVPREGRPLLGSWDVVLAAESAYSQTERSRYIVPLLVEAYLAADLRQRATDLLAQALTRNDLEDAQWLELAGICIREGLPQASAFLDRAEADGATLDTARLRAGWHHRAGNTAAGIAALQAVKPAAGEASFNAWARMHAEYLALAESPDILDAANALLDNSGDEAAINAGVVLGFNAVWQDEPTVRRAIDVLKNAIGEDSTRVRLAEASRVLRFHASDPRQIAETTIAMDTLVKQSPDSLPARTLLANLLLAAPQPNHVEAIRHLRYAVDRNPRRLDLYPQLISLLQRHGDFAAADGYLQTLGRRRGTDADLRRSEMALLEAQGRFDEAISRLTSIIDPAASSEIDLLTLASYNLRAGRAAQAEPVVRELLQKHPRSALTLQFASMFYGTTGRFNEGLRLLQEATLDEGEARRAMLLGAFYHQQGYLNEADEWLRQAVRLDDANANGWHMLAQHLLVTGQVDKAMEAARSGLARDPDHNPLRLMIASISLASGPEARREAIKLFEEMEGDNRALLDTVRLFDGAIRADGTLATDSRRLNEARQLAQKHPTFLLAQRLAVMMHIEAGRVQEATDLAQQALARIPTSPEPAKWLVDLHVSDGRMNEALLAARAWRSRSLESPFEADITIARLLLYREDARGAVDALRPHARKIEQGREIYAVAFSAWLQALLLEGHVAEAFRLIEPTYEKQDELIALWFETAGIMPATGAEQALTIVERLCEQEVSRRLDLALAWAKLGQRAGRNAHFERAGRLVDATTVEAERRFVLIQCRAMIAEMREQNEQAVAFYRQVLELVPDNVAVLNNLAYLLATKFQRFEEARPLSAKAIALVPEIPELLDTHAVVLLGLNETAEAEQLLRKALEIRRDDVTLLMSLCRVQIARGERGEARRTLESAENIVRHTPFARQELRDGVAKLRAEYDASAAVNQPE